MSYEHIPEASLVVDWRDRAACRQPGLSPTVFFPEGHGLRRIADPWAEARDICAWCSVTSDCLIYALDHDIQDGMFGSMTPDERAEIKRRQR